MERDLVERSAQGGIGIDLGAEYLHCARLDGAGCLVEARLFRADELAALVEWVGGGAVRVAIDAPGGLSAGHHLDDTTVSRKFRQARCSEIELGRQCGIWVPWVTPIDESVTPGWMRLGIELHRRLGDRGVEPMEVYPHGVFHRLSGGVKLVKKTSLEGLRARLALLRAAGVAVPIELLTHDGVDAVAAAVVAWGPSEGIGCPLGDDHDGSRIWLPLLTPARSY
jgi:predicted nuclease with RNAse H fold